MLFFVIYGGNSRLLAQVVSQSSLGENACGPCAIVNALQKSTGLYQDGLRYAGGQNAMEISKSLIERFSKMPSQSYPGEMVYDPKRGITWRDMEFCMSSLFAHRKDAMLKGGYLDRQKDELLSDHVRRVHKLLANSLKAGLPVVTSLRSFAPAQQQDGKHEWVGLHGHFVTIVSVQDQMTDSELGFRFEYADSFTGNNHVGYAYADEARNFTAAKGDAVKWEWLNDRPFLLVAAPSLRLGTQKQPWYLRTIITLNHAVYASATQ